jgi:hypothetical protein
VKLAPLAVAAAALAVLVALLIPGRAAAADECRGLMVCIPITGPWVVVSTPARSARLSRVEYYLNCPRGSVVGGTDARVSDRWLDIAFLGTVGSPVGPGTTTHDALDFIGTYVGPARRPSSFQPFLGCVPTAGGGGRSTTIVSPLRPGQPLVRRVRNVVVPPGRQLTVTQSCAQGERLVGEQHALAFRTPVPPPVEVLDDVHASSRQVEGRIVVVASRGFAVPTAERVEVQVQALCARRA